MLRINIRALSITSISLLMLSFITMLSTPALAANDPNVFIAFDATTSGCALHYTKGLGTANTTQWDVACAPGTNISTKEIKLSQATAMGESYVLVPPSTSSSVVIQKFDQDVTTMMEAKRNSIKAKTSSTTFSAVTPESVGCGQSGSISTGTNPAWKVEDDTYIATLYYSISSDCQAAYLQNFTVQPLSDNDADGHGLDKMLYSNSSWDPQCPNLITYYPNTYNYTLNSYQTKGYYFVPYIAWGSACGLELKSSMDMLVN